MLLAQKTTRGEAAVNENFRVNHSQPPPAWTEVRIFCSYILPV